MPVIKEMVDGRARPAGWSTPRARAIRAATPRTRVFYAWLALTVAVRVRPGWTYGTALIAAGLALTAAIGLSRVYLGVHYLSDVERRLGARRRGVRRLRGVGDGRHRHLRQNPRRLMPIVAKIGTEYLLFGGAGLISLLAFAALILVPAIGSFGRTWEKATAVFLVSFFVLVALLAIGIAIGIAIVYYWADITGLFGEPIGAGAARRRCESST